MKVLLCIIATLVAIIYSFVNSIESPPQIGENYAIKFVAFFNLIWLIPYLLYYLKKNDFKAVGGCFMIFTIAYLPFLYMRFYTIPFSEQQWKTGLDSGRLYDKYPAHKNGGMVEDIIERKILIGLSKEQVENKLGKNYYIDKWNNSDNMVYFYSHTNIFDGCDKLFVKLKDSVCIEAFYGGCD